MNISVNVDATGIDLTTPVGEHSVQVGEDDWTREPMTLGDAVAARIATALQQDEHWRPLRKRVMELRDEEIREQVKPVVAEAVAASVQPTNGYGQPTGEPVSLAEVIVKEAKTVLTKRDNYDRGPTYVQKIVAEEVDKAIRKELAEVIADEKAKVVAAVRAKAAELIAQAVKEGVGR